MRSALCLFILLILSIAVYPATKTWDGGGADNNWQTAANWSTDVAPVGGDDLVFPASAAQFATNNNLASLTFASLTIEGGNYTIGGSTLQLTNGLTVNGGSPAVNTLILVASTQTFRVVQGSTLTLGILFIASGFPNPFNLTLDGAGNFGIGVITGTGSLTKTGLGSSLIASAGSYSGRITLNDGILVVDANVPNSTVNVNSVAPTGVTALSGFGGTGTVGATTVTQGVISAGTLTSPTGILNISSGLTFTANGAYVCKIGGTTPGASGHDQLNVAGTVNLSNARLAPLPWNGFRPVIGDTFVVLKNDGTDAINGTFLNAPEGSVFAGPLNTAFQVSYFGGDGNDVSIKRVARAAFDFDGDGKTDVSTFRPSANNWNILYSGSNSTSSTLWGLGTDKIAPADYDGDNRTDIATFRPSNGTWYIVNSATTTFTIVQFGANGDLPVPNDFDGDGRSDLAVFRPSDGVWFELRSLANQVSIQQFGSNGDIPQMADFDGDGLGDLCVFRPTDGTWHFYQSSNSAYVAFPFGTAGDKPVAADYDGDGRTDVAVFRATADSDQPDFYILLSGNSAYYGISWGVPGDLPVVGDYDGDGKSDIAIFRPSNQTWYLLRSTSGFTSQVWGIANDIPLPSAFVP